MTAVTAGLSEYEIRHLVEHLHAAANGAAVHRLLRMEDSQEGANAWFAAQDELRNVDGYVADLRFAFDLADPQAPALGARYALMMSSARSVAATVPAALLARAVKAEVRTIDEALAQVERIVDPGLAAETLIALAPHAPAGRHAELRLLATRIDDEDARARALVGLASTPEEGELPELLDEIERLAPRLDDQTVGRALDVLAPRLGARYAPRLMALARRMRTGTLRANALAALAPIVNRERQEVLTEALDSVPSADAAIEQPALTALLATMPGNRGERVRRRLIRDALAAIEHAPDVVRLAQNSLRSDEQMLAARRAAQLDQTKGGLDEMLALAPAVPDAELGSLLELARGIDPTIRDDRTMARLIRAVAPHVSSATRDDAVAVVDELAESPDRCFALAALGELNRAAAEAALLADPAERAKALFGLGESTVDAAVRAADEVGDPAIRADLLLSAGHAALVPQALDAVREVHEPWRRVALLLRAIALTDDCEPLVQESLVLIAERAAENFHPTPSAQLAELAPYLSPALTSEAIDTALRIDERLRPYSVGALSAVAPHLPAADLDLVVEVSGRLGSAKRARVLQEIAAFAPATLHPTILDQAAELDAEDIQNVVAVYADRIAPALLEQALQICRPIGNKDIALTTATDLAVAARITPVPEFVFDGAIATGDLNPIVDLMSDEQLAQALGAADARPAGDYERAQMLGELARVFPPERLGELTKRVRRNDTALADVIEGGAERFPQALVDRLADRAAALRRPVERFNALARLAPRLKPATRERLRRGSNDLNVLLALMDGAEPRVRDELLDAAAEAANLLESEAAFVDAYRRLSHYFDGDERTAALEKALSYAYVIEDADERGIALDDVLSDLAQVDPARVLDQLGALDGDGQRRMLPWLLAHLDARRQGEVVQRAERLESEDARADALASLARTKGLTPASVGLLHQAGQRLTGVNARAKVLAALLPSDPDGVATELRALTGSRDLTAPGRAAALSALMALGSDDARVTDFAALLAARRSPMSRERLDFSVVFDGATDATLLWSRLMRVLADHPRSTIFDALSAFSDVAAERGEPVSAELVEAVSDCVRWWR